MASLSKKSFTYLAGVAWSKKKSFVVVQNNKYENLEQLESETVDAGQDAFFHVSTDYGIIQGVADGVGSWGEVSNRLGLCILVN